MTYNQIPQELKTYKNWVCYRVAPRADGTAGKIPVNPKTLADAKADDPSTWGTFEEATEAARRNPQHVAGIGFEFGNSPFFGVDLDHIMDGAGNVLQEAQEIIDALDSYTEYSPSGHGVHILCRGSYPDGWKKKKAALAGVGDVEMYQTGRYFTVTGNPYGTLRKLAERSQEAVELQARYKTTQEPKGAQEGHRAPQEAVELADGELLRIMFQSRNGADISALWGGDTRGDHSTADLALVNHLLFWTYWDTGAVDLERVDRLFRASGLYREKWEREDYRERTMQKALAGFNPPSQCRAQASAADFADQGAPASPPVGSPNQAPAPDPLEGLQTAADYLRGRFAADREQFQGYKKRKTGFADIDEYTGGLYPGLYVLGALSSLGKTTFAHQLADQLAAAGDTVLFFSLEQSTFELTTKSLARESFKLLRERKTQDGALSSIEIRSGKSSGLMRDAYKSYLEYAGRVIIKECNFGETAESIAQTVAAFIEKTGITPVVMVDYLQIIPAQDPRMGDKEKTDQNMRRLKILQRDRDLVLFVISSINRNNYAAQIGFESFKESGGIEYTADVVWGMQYAVISKDPVFNSDKKVGDKRKKLQEAKAETPRDIELVCLKNRYGRDFSTQFAYYPKYDFFEPTVFPDNSTDDFFN